MKTIGKDKLAKTLGYFAAFITLGLVSASLGPTLPRLAEQTRADLGQISFLFTARSLGYLLGSLLVGRFYDRLPGHSLMAASLGLMAILVAGIPVVPQLGLLIGVLLLIGVFESTIDVGGNTLIVWVHGREVGPFMNGLHFFFGVGTFLAPLIVVWTMKIDGNITWAYWTFALCILPIAAGIARLPNPPSPTTFKDGQAGKTNFLLVAALAVFLFLYVGAEVSFGGWIFTYAVARNLLDHTQAAYLTSAFWGAYTFGRLLSVPLAARFKPFVLLFSNLTGCVLSVALLLFLPHSVPAVWMGAVGLGLSMAAIFPTVLTFSERQMTMTGQITGWLFVGSSLGAMTMPWIIGQVMKAIGPQPIMGIIGADLLGAILILTGIGWRMRVQRPSAILISEQRAEVVI